MWQTVPHQHVLLAWYRADSGQHRPSTSPILYVCWVKVPLEPIIFSIQTSSGCSWSLISLTMHAWSRWIPYRLVLPRPVMAHDTEWECHPVMYTHTCTHIWDVCIHACTYTHKHGHTHMCPHKHAHEYAYLVIPSKMEDPNLVLVRHSINISFPKTGQASVVQISVAMNACKFWSISTKMSTALCCFAEHTLQCHLAQDGTDKLYFLLINISAKMWFKWYARHHSVISILQDIAPVSWTLLISIRTRHPHPIAEVPMLAHLYMGKVAIPAHLYMWNVIATSLFTSLQSCVSRICRCRRAEVICCCLAMWSQTHWTKNWNRHARLYYLHSSWLLAVQASRGIKENHKWCSFSNNDASCTELDSPERR